MNPFILPANGMLSHVRERLLLLVFSFFLYASAANAQIILPLSRSSGYDHGIGYTSKVLFAGNAWEYVTTSDNSIPVGRHECGYVETGGKFHLIGGRGLPAHNVYDPSLRKWTTAAPIPGGKELHHFQAVSYKGKIYILGAFTGGFPTETPVPDVYIYDPLVNTWQVLANQIPSGRRRGAAGVVVYNNKIYLIGGITNGHTNGWVNWMDEFDPETLTWKILPDAPHQRDHFQAAVIMGKVYIAGGRKSSYPNTLGLTDPTVDVFDFGTTSWSTLSSGSNIPTPRAGNVAVVMNNELVIIAGESGTNGYHREVEAFNPLTNSWRSLPPLNNGRNGPGGVIFNGRIYVVAGVHNGTEITSQEAYFNDPNPAVLAPVADVQAAINASPVQINLHNHFIDDQSTSALIYSVEINSNPSLISTSIANGILQLTIAPNQTGNTTIKIRATDAGGLYIEDEFRVEIMETPPFSRFINCGGNAVNFNGQSWVADQNNSGGSAYSTSSAIAGTTNDAVYQTERFGKTFGYSIPLANGVYTVRLHFAEIYWTSSGKRVFNVNIENNAGSLTNFDIFSKAGNQTAHVEEFRNITVTDGALSINLTTVADNAKISGIEITNSPGTVTSCNAPSSTSATNITSRSVQLSWNPVATATGYNLEFRKSSDANWITAGQNISSNAFTLSGLEPGIAYLWRVQTVCSTSYSSFAQSTFTTNIPLADAGQDQVIQLPDNTANLNGSGTVENGSITGYEWSQVSGPANAIISNSSVRNPVISSLLAGTYIFNLKVTDNHGGISLPDQVSITVNPPGNKPPVADAGTDISIELPQSAVTLNGSGTDEDGSISSYSWSQFSGPNTAIFQSTNLEDPVVSGLIEGNYIFSLLVKDNQNTMSAADQVSVTVRSSTPVNKIPVADAGPNRTVNLPVSSVTLNGGGSDEDGSISGYSWSQVSGPNTAIINAVSMEDPVVSGLVAGTYVFSLIVRDNTGALSLSDQVTVNVNPAQPAFSLYINCGGAAVSFNGQNWMADQYYSGGSTYSSNNAIAGTTNDAVYQKERYGKTFSYAIPVVNGSYTVKLHFAEIYWTSAGKRVLNVNIENGKAVAGNLDIFAKAGNNNAYAEEFQNITVTDGTLNINFTTVTDNAKISGIEITGGTGTQSCPPASGLQSNGITSKTATLNWTFVGGAQSYRVEYKPASQQTWNIAAENTLSNNHILSGLQAGVVYDWRVRVNCSEMVSSYAATQFTTVIPLANAGPDKSIILPASSVQLNGSGSVSGGTISGYSWTQLSGPNTALFDNKFIAQPQLNNLIAGTYEFSLVVTDQPGSSSLPDKVMVTVTSNLPPIANAGADKSITLPVSSTTLTGSGSDASGIKSYNWTQVSGPNTATFSSKTVAVTSVSNLIAGVYMFELVVTDNTDLQSTPDEVRVTVNTAPSGPQVISFTLVNASNETDIMTISNGATINLTQLPSGSVNIRANTSPGTVGRVAFTMTGPQNRNISESVAPYALFGDNNGNYNSWTPAIGTYTLTATPYTSSSGGSAGSALTIVFTVVNQSGAARSMMNSSISANGMSAPASSLGIGTGNYLLVQVMPNPSPVNFTLQIRSGTAEDIRLRITDISGRLIEERRIRGIDQRVEVGQNWKEGLYFLQITQGKNSSRIRLLKIR